MRGLSGKVGIVAGGGRGIGAATARRLAQEGAHVVIGDLMGEWAREVAEDVVANGGKAVGVDLDGTSAESQAAIVAKVLPVIIRLAGFLVSKIVPAVADTIGIVIKIIAKMIAVNAM